MPYVITKENKKKKGPYSLLTLKKKKEKECANALFSSQLCKTTSKVLR